MSKYLKVALIILAITLVVSAGCIAWKCYTQISRVNSKNICSDYDIIPQVIINNHNPITRPLFLKKRNNDCRQLLDNDREIAVKERHNDKCEILSSSRNSVVMLVDFYVNEMFDRENASKEMNAMIKDMLPYDYCENYYTNLTPLIDLKRRLGL